MGYSCKKSSYVIFFCSRIGRSERVFSSCFYLPSLVVSQKKNKSTSLYLLHRSMGYSCKKTVGCNIFFILFLIGRSECVFFFFSSFYLPSLVVYQKKNKSTSYTHRHSGIDGDITCTVHFLTQTRKRQIILSFLRFLFLLSSFPTVFPCLYFSLLPCFNLFI